MRRERISFTLVAAAALVASVLVSRAFAMNCVEFVRSASDFDLSGNAWSWWGHAAGHYDRGSEPREGSVLVFKRTRHMPGGHVALVSGVIDDHTVLVDHANWASRPSEKGRVERDVAVIDCSRHHDWTAVCVWNSRYHSYGRPYPTDGFIYPDG